MYFYTALVLQNSFAHSYCFYSILLYDLVSVFPYNLGHLFIAMELTYRDTVKRIFVFVFFSWKDTTPHPPPQLAQWGNAKKDTKLLNLLWKNFHWEVKIIFEGYTNFLKLKYWAVRYVKYSTTHFMNDCPCKDYGVLFKNGKITAHSLNELSGDE
jgi:hypothetical protein